MTRAEIQPPQSCGLSDETRAAVESALIADVSVGVSADISAHAELGNPAMSFSRVDSEEGEVWRVSRDDDPTPIAWVKRHAQPAKAKREREASRMWGGALRAPRVLAELDARTLLLEHCTGVPLDHLVRRVTTLETREVSLIGSSLGRQLASSHLSPVNDADSTTLSEALRARARSSLRNLDSVNLYLNGAQASLEVMSAYHSALESLTEVSQVGLRALPEEIEWACPILAKRVPCHRDLTSEHIFCALEARQIQVRVIDWGQSRLDHWVSDWCKLYVEWREAPALWRSTWRAYWDHITAHLRPPQRGHQGEGWGDRSATLLERYALVTMSAALASLAVGSLRWAARRRVKMSEAAHHISASQLRDLVWERGLAELSAFSALQTRIKSA